MAAPKTQRTAGSVQSVERTFDLFEALVEAGQAVPLSELSVRAGLPLGTTHRLLATLTARGYARQDPESRAYAVGYKVMDWASRVGANQLLEVARPHLRTLMHETGETVNLVILDHTQIVYADQVAPSGSCACLRKWGIARRSIRRGRARRCWLSDRSPRPAR